MRNGRLASNDVLYVSMHDAASSGWILSVHPNPHCSSVVRPVSWCQAELKYSQLPVLDDIHINAGTESARAANRPSLSARRVSSSLVCVISWITTTEPVTRPRSFRMRAELT